MNMTQFNRIVEIRTKLISLGTCITGYLYAYTKIGGFSASRFLILLAAVLCVDMGTTGFNTYFDYVKGTDRKENNYEEDKVLVHEGTSPLSALLISLSLFFAAAVLGLILASMSSYVLIAAGGVSMLVGFLYTAGPFPISRTPFGELFAGGFLGTVLFMISFYVASLTLTLDAFLVSLPHLFLIGMILTVNNTCDRESDIIAGRRTLTICLSENMNGRLLTAEFLAAYLAAFILAGSGVLPFWMFLTLLPSLIASAKIYGKMKKRGFSLKTKGVSMKSVSLMFLLFIISYAAALVLQLLFS